MTDTVINMAGISIYGKGLLVVFCYLWGSYIFYKKAIESHFEGDSILDIIVLGAFWGFLFARLFFVIVNIGTFWNHWSRVFLLTNYPGLDRWGLLVGIVLALYRVSKKLKYRFVDLLDYITLGVIATNSLYWTGINLIRFSWLTVLLGILMFIGFVFFWYIETRYRLIGWYRAQKNSAKSGFVSGFGLAFLGLSFLLELFLYGNMKMSSLIWVLLMVVTGLILVYIRSGRVLSDDINSLKIWKKIKK